MNKETVSTPLASGLKYLLAAFVALLVGKGLLTSETAASLDGEIVAFATAGAGLLATLVIGIVQNFLAKRNKSGGTTGSGGNLVPLLLCMATVIPMALGLSSCNLPFDEYPITGSIGYRDPDTGAKAGLVWKPGEKPKGSIRVPRYDEEGNLIGWIDLEGPLSREVKVNPEK